ncbi:MAG: trehalose-6-phosphate synthase, partial [SAR202 cluster bacterium]|nr:trehalose-6-phosphate synthase [SAR202 cluster bacterium]
MADSAELNELCTAVFAKRSLILVSNRGPVEHQMPGGGRPEARRGSGSVVTAFSSLAQKFEFTWVASAMGEGD